MKRVALLGATGSIGAQAIEIVERSPELELCALMSGTQPLDALAAAHGVEHVQVGGSACAAPRRERARHRPQRHRRLRRRRGDAVGARARHHARAREQGEPRRGRRARRRRAPSRRRPAAPVDSEHSALFQCLEGRDPETVEALVLTASGGPFRGRSRAELDHVTVDGRARTSDLVDGTKDHCGLGHSREQGPRADRGALAVRHPLRPDRRRRASQLDRALARPLPGRRPARASRQPGHARSDLLRAHAIRSVRPCLPSRSIWPPGSTSGSRLPTTRRSRCCRSPGRPGSAEARSLRLQRGQRGRRRGVPRRADRIHGDRRHRRGALEHVDGAPARDLDDLVAADAEARRAAERRLVPA